MTAAATSPSRVVASSSSSVSVFPRSAFVLPPSAFSAPVSSSSTSSSTSSSSSSIPPSILKTFDSQTDVFITGGIGFVGSVVVEQLLRLTDVKRIFLLIRSKEAVSKVDGKESRLSAQQRLGAFVDSSALFDSLRDDGGGKAEGKERPPLRGVFEFGSGRG